MVTSVGGMVKTKKVYAVLMRKLRDKRIFGQGNERVTFRCVLGRYVVCLVGGRNWPPMASFGISAVGFPGSGLD